MKNPPLAITCTLGLIAIGLVLWTGLVPLPSFQPSKSFELRIRGVERGGEKHVTIEVNGQVVGEEPKPQEIQPSLGNWATDIAKETGRKRGFGSIAK